MPTAVNWCQDSRPGFTNFAPPNSPKRRKRPHRPAAPTAHRLPGSNRPRTQTRNHRCPVHKPGTDADTATPCKASGSIPRQFAKLGKPTAAATAAAQANLPGRVHGKIRNESSGGARGRAQGDGRVNSARNSASARWRPSSVRTTDFALPAGFAITPLRCSRSSASQSNPFQARRPSCSVSHNNARTAPSILSVSMFMTPTYGEGNRLSGARQIAKNKLSPAIPGIPAPISPLPPINEIPNKQKIYRKYKY